MDFIKKRFDSDDMYRRFSTLVAVLLGFIIGGIILLLFGYDPLAAYSALIQGAFLSPRTIGSILFTATPYILVGLAAAFGFRAGVVNIGIAGQMYVGGLFAVIVGVHFDLPYGIHAAVAITAAVIGGALWAFVPAIMKLKLGTSEIFTTIMMNYIALQGVIYMAKQIIPSEFEVQSAQIQETASIRSDALTAFFGGTYVNYGLFIALVAAIIYNIYFKKSVSGYKMKAVGNNKNAAKYAGINVSLNSFLSLIISGALAGLAAGVYYTGATTHLELGTLPRFGFDAITIALIGANGGFGIVVAGLFYGMMYTGGPYMSQVAKVPTEIVSIILAIVIYFAAATIYIQNNLHKIVGKIRGDKNG